MKTKADVQQVVVWIAEHADEIEAELTKGAAEGDPCPSFLRPLFAAAEWLSFALREQGATDKESEDACFALGQRAFGHPDSSPVIAVDCYNKWIDGQRDRPGAELAEDLILGRA